MGPTVLLGREVSTFKSQISIIDHQGEDISFFLFFLNIFKFSRILSVDQSLPWFNKIVPWLSYKPLWLSLKHDTCHQCSHSPRDDGEGRRREAAPLCPPTSSWGKSLTLRPDPSPCVRLRDYSHGNPKTSYFLLFPLNFWAHRSCERHL